MPALSPHSPVQRSAALNSGRFVIVNHGATGATETITTASGTYHRCTLDADCTFTFSRNTTGEESDHGARFYIELAQDATGSRIATWPAAVKGAPTLTTTASRVDLLAFYWNGSVYICESVKLDTNVS